MNRNLPQLAPPEGFGYLGDFRVRATPLPEIDVSSPEEIGSHFANLPEPTPLPDLVAATQGPVTTETVGRLLSVANGEDAGWVGVSATDAISRLQSLGMPVHAEDWDVPTWESKIAQYATQPNALSLLGY